MTPQETKRILASYRPGSDSVVDMAVGEALSELERDPALKTWFEQQQAFHGAMRRSLGEIPISANLPARILAQIPIVPMRSWWQRPMIWSAAAALFVIGGLFLWFAKPFAPDNWGKFRERTITWSEHQYRMDIVTNDLAAVRNFHASRGAPSDYALPPRLAALTTLGGGLLSWRDQPTSMVCLNFANRDVLYLFVIESNNVRNPPSSAPRFATLESHLTASWTDGNKSYLLAAPRATGDLHQFF